MSDAETGSTSSHFDVDERMEEICELMQDSNTNLHEKVASLLALPQVLQKHRMKMEEINELTSKQCHKLFSSIPLEVFQCIMQSTDAEFRSAKPIVAHILAYCCQSTNRDIYSKFKPIVTDLIKLISFHDDIETDTVNEIGVIITYMPFTSEEKSILFDALRHVCSFFVAQKSLMDIQSLLSVTRLLLSKIFQFVSVGDDPSVIDSRGWSVVLLSIMRSLIKERPEKFEQSVRIGMWDVIGSVSRLIGPKWFLLDVSFAKLVAQLNTVEIQMCLHKPCDIVPAVFARHLRILEVFICAVHDDEIFSSIRLNDVLLAIGSGVKFVLQFWSEAANTNEPLSNEVKMNLFTFAIFILSRGELEIVEERIQKQIGPLMLTEAMRLVDESSDDDMESDSKHLFIDFFEKMPDLLILDDRVPLLAAKFLKRLSMVVETSQFRVGCMEMSVSLVNLRGRVDWYSSKSISDAFEVFDTLHADDKPDVEGIMKLLNKLPRVN